ncbi:uncharacterized protein LOC109141601 isoform X2 [Larimichthys crocea]|nr:uncharacterized protein LOC109141601 isoform X2 [Larimichthys crocea]
MSRVPEDNSRDNRPFPLPACVSSGLAEVLVVFCIGLLSGAAGGLLLGGTAVVTLQSLELLADNRLLMEQLEKHIMDNVYYIKYNNIVYDIYISVLAVMFGVFSSTLSLAAGISIGFKTYSLVIKIKGEAAMGKALMWAGQVCLMGVTATGYIVGLTLESFLSIIFNWTMSLCFLISVPVTWLVVPMISEICCKSRNCDPIIWWFFTPLAAVITLAISSLCKIRIYLVAVLIPTIMAARELGNYFELSNVTVPLMLIISDVYYIAGWQIVSLQSPTFTNISSAVVEAIIVGVLASLLWSVTVGMSLFVSWQKGGAFKIGATAAASGSAVLGAIKMALPVLGPGPTIGALIGVAGAVGVSLSAAGAVADQFGQALRRYGFVGRLGLTVGAAVGAFLSSCAHSGLSGMFMALCAATIPAGVFIKQFFESIPVHSDSTLGEMIVFLLLSTLICYIYGLIAFNRIISFEIVECKFLLCSIIASFFSLLL